MYYIRKVAVLGSGLMGAGIAAHLANCGLEVILLDIAPKELNEDEKKKGLTLNHKEVKNRLVLNARERMKDKKSMLLYTGENIDLIKFGNLEDDLELLREVDWVIEAVVENEKIKKELYEKIQMYLKEDAFISTNTSGISVNSLSEALNKELKDRFFVTHFFNPPRYMKLLEIIPSNHTKPEILEYMTQFCENKLGKGVVIAKDTPGFIANRIGIYSLGLIIHKIYQHNLTFEEADALTGTEIGRPKTGTFRLLDMIGNDTALFVAEYLKENIKELKEKEILNFPSYIKEMVNKGYLGDKTKLGFYKKEGKDILVLEPETFNYRPKKKVEFIELEEAKKAKTLKEKLQTLVYGEGKPGNFLWDVIKNTLLFTAGLVPEISDSIKDIDNAMKWGFNWEVGPFELWDLIGVRKSTEKMKMEGETIPPIVNELLNSGKEQFYSDKKLDLNSKNISANSLKEQGKVIINNDHASLIDMGDNVACFVLHSPNSSVTGEVVEFTHKAISEVEKNYKGMIISSIGKNFCVGANLPFILNSAREKKWDAIDELVSDFQNMNMAIKYSSKPIVAAPYGMALGAGAEITMHCSQARSFAELYIGLVEVGVGLLPGGGGTKELLIKSQENINDNKNIDLTPLVLKNFETITTGKVSKSEPDAKKIGYLRSMDKIIMNKDRQLFTAKNDVLHLFENPKNNNRNKKIRVGGEGLYALLKYSTYQMYKGGFITEYEHYLANKIGYVLCGGNIPNNSMVDEQYLLDLEREAFVSLCGEQKTQERIEHMLKTGRPLRN